MAGVKGRSKTGGRKKGTPNKRTRELMELLEEENFCPARALIQIYRKALKHQRGFDLSVNRVIKALEGEDPVAIREAVKAASCLSENAPAYLSIAEHAAKEVMNYAFPKRKAIEHTGKDGSKLGGRVVVLLPSNGREAKRKAA